MIKPVDVVLLDLGNTLYADPKPWPEILRRADEALWASLRAAGVRAEPAEVYGQYKTLLDLYNSDHRKDLSEATTRRVLTDRLERSGQRVSDGTVRQALRAMYAITQTNWVLEPEAIPLLDSLKDSGFRLGVISNAADEDNTQTLIDKGGIRAFFEVILSSAAFGKRKPDPGIFRKALDHFGLPADRAVMVGDTYEADIVGAKVVGMHTIWIPHGGANDAESHPAADQIVSSLLEIPGLISR